MEDEAEKDEWFYARKLWQQRHNALVKLAANKRKLSHDKREYEHSLKKKH